MLKRFTPYELIRAFESPLDRLEEMVTITIPTPTTIITMAPPLLETHKTGEEGGGEPLVCYRVVGIFSIFFFYRYFFTGVRQGCF